MRDCISIRKIFHFLCRDSISDNENGNPLVANFHEEPSVEQSLSHVKELPPVDQVKVNPLAKNKSKSTQESAQNIKMNLFGERQSSISSDEIDVPAVMKVADSAGSNDEFDSWMNGTADRRRSPDGVEDNSSSIVGPEPMDKAVDDEKVSLKRYGCSCVKQFLLKKMFFRLHFRAKRDTKARRRKRKKKRTNQRKSRERRRKRNTSPKRMTIWKNFYPVQPPMPMTTITRPFSVGRKCFKNERISCCS